MTLWTPGTDPLVRSFGNLRYLAARQATVTVGAYDAEYQICQITFAKSDGSLFVSFPYLPQKGGLLSIAEFPSDQSGKVTLSFGEQAKSTSHLAKYAHHPDGNVHFSQDGKIRTEVRRSSFRLDGPIGHLFQLHVYHPSGFTAFGSQRRRTGRAYLRNRFQTGLPAAVLLSAEWRRKKDIIDNIRPPGGISGPVSKVQSRASGHEFVVHFFGQPEGFPLQDHVLMLSVSETHALPNVTEPSLMFMGGYDLHEIAKEGDAARQTACLLAIYPASTHQELADRCRSVDLLPPAS